jgi:hypothetical protein
MTCNVRATKMIITATLRETQDRSGHRRPYVQELAPLLLSCDMGRVLMRPAHRHVKALAILLLALIFGP